MESPCIRICVLNPVTGLCQGCARTMAEIVGWAGFTDAERRRIMGELAGRDLGPDAARLTGDTSSTTFTPVMVQAPRPSRSKW